MPPHRDHVHRRKNPLDKSQRKLSFPSLLEKLFPFAFNETFGGRPTKCPDVATQEINLGGFVQRCRTLVHARPRYGELLAEFHELSLSSPDGHHGSASLASLEGSFGTTA
jgi:hypothetical protein